VNESAISDEDATRLLGPKCPACGWRSDDGSKHRPAIGDLAACERWEEGDDD
jgi:hypothetical protein